MEFTWAWDEGDSLRVAEERKANQYAAAEKAVNARAQWKSRMRHIDGTCSAHAVQIYSNKNCSSSHNLDGGHRCCDIKYEHLWGERCKV